MRKGKITMTISIACTAFILTMIMFTQFKTVDETDIIAIETMRETELRTELATWKEKYEEIEQKIQDTDNKIAEYNKELDADANTSSLLEKEVKEAESYLGKTNMKGQGIIVTLQDKDIFSVIYSDLLRLVNELNTAGADAISINDERIVASSDITSINGSIILVNTKKISGPYVVKAIGDKKYFESALNIKGGYIDEMEASGIGIEYVIDDNIVIPAYDGEQEFEYAKENIEKE